METTSFVPLVSWWRSESQDRGAARALATLYVELAQRSPAETARFLTRQALDLTPACSEALELLEQLAPQSQIELRARYERFLETAPFHRHSPRVREKLIDLLVERGRYDEALPHVRLLTKLSVLSSPRRDEIARACTVPLPGHEPVDSIRELDEFDLDPLDLDGLDLDIELMEAAE